MPSSSNNEASSAGNTPMTKQAAGRIQATQARADADMSKGGFAARAQGAGDRNANANAGGATAKGADGGMKKGS